LRHSSLRTRVNLLPDEFALAPDISRRRLRICTPARVRSRMLLHYVSAKIAAICIIPASHVVGVQMFPKGN